MSKLLYSATMSLDGFIAGAGGDMAWLTRHLVHAPEVDDLMDSIGALLIGSRTFGGDDPNRGTDSEGAFGGKWHGQCVVLTHDPPPGPADSDVSFATDLGSAVAAAKDAADGKYVNVLGANVAKQLIEADLLDEILVFVAPVMLGDGTRLFDHPGGTEVGLEPVEHRPIGPMSVWLRVVR